ncbi:MAG: DUF4178 domain-containing protein [Cocleimonas sp.]|nr:DUF4178 domain-containing protein [Cocleimonas sp.]
MSESKIRSINCTSCGAPLKLHAGHKIKSLTCEYCGAVMNPQDEFSVLAKFSEQQPPSHSPLKTGDQGKLKGVPFTVVGMIEWYAEGDSWIDYQVFSPTHGYAWLVYETGHWVFLRRTRNLPNKSLWTLKRRAKVKMKQQTFLFYEKFNAKITYVAGELTWIARMGDTTSLAEAIDPPYLFSEERNKYETEYYFGEYIEATEIKQQFNISKHYPVAPIHRLQRYKSKFLQPLAKVAKPFAFVFFIISFAILIFMQGSSVMVKPVVMKNTGNGQVQSSYEFSISKPNHLILLTLNTHNANALLNARVKQRATGKTIINLGKNNAKTSEYRIDKRIRSVEASFEVPKAGIYTLSFSANTQLPVKKVKLVITENHVGSRYFFWLLLFSLAAILISSFSRRSFESQRWKLVED